MFPWNSLVFSMKAKATQLCMTLCNPMDCPWNSPGQNTGVGSLSLLQGIFSTQGSNPGLLHCRWILLTAELQGKPKNTGVGSLYLLQWIIPTQESNPGSPALPNSLPTELSGKPQSWVMYSHFSCNAHFLTSTNHTTKSQSTRREHLIG